MNVKDKYYQEVLRFWKDLTPNQRELVDHSIIKKHFNKGEAMRSSSDQCSGLFLIESGQVRAYIISENGKEITLYRLFDRDVCIFSASCIMKNISFDIFIETEKETTAYLIPTSIFDKLSKESMAVQVFANELMASRFSDVMWIMEQALFMTLDKRLAIFLLEQSNIEESDTIKITHEKIANHLGSAREVITRMLKYFQEEGIISLSRGTIHIVNRKRLEQLTLY
ncbi:Crp/Fnr family transcriptional regulator [Herbinix luporum]|jgi:CRP/FNR family transcriptional regulator|uniref:Crp/Fnr family transcriptional regulator n=1 Tax=Herbinix luporum TaxID=1679721 RepID=UPI0017630DB1|nr:Crp/Fnr family transcriptional regulator [Herbinix luporum]HHT57408.1 Crp/Fnr family transcriptional regulator [Herbinix luporum]